MTIPDQTILNLSQPFTKTWRIRNAGTCTWTTDYKIVLTGGDQLNASNSARMPYNVAPGQTVDLSVQMTAPEATGHYEGIWQLQTSDGRTFGVGPLGNDKIWVRIRVVAPAYSTATVQPSVPTATMTATVTLSPSQTVTVEPSATPSSQIAYDFAGSVCAAQWQSNTGLLPCPGKDGDPNGFVLSLSNPQLEDGTTTALPTILTFPQDSADGYILGVYPEYQVQPGDHLQASVGCEYNATSCSVLFRISYLDQSNNSHDLWTLGEFYDGRYFNLDLDLSQEAGQKVKFVLYVSSLGSGTGDRALWVAPRIMHFSVAPTTETSTITPATPTGAATSIPTPTATASATLEPTALPTASPAPASQPSTAQQVWDSIVSFFQQLFGGK